MAKTLNHYTFFVQLNADGNFKSGWVEDDYKVEDDSGPDRNKINLDKDDVTEIVASLKALHDDKLGPNFKPLDRKQLLLGLAELGKRKSDVDAVIAAIPEGIDQIKAEVWWNESAKFHRTHPLISQVGAALSLTDEQMTTAWLTAQEL